MFLGELTWCEVEAHKHKVLVMPIGSLEQHGHHTPLLTDSLIGGEVVRRVEAELGEEAVFLPMLWVGASNHHRAFPGTISLSNDLYVKVLIDMLESAIGAGFRKIFLLNSHGGNVVPGEMAMYDVQLRHRFDKPDLYMALACWWTISAKEVAAIESLEQKHVTHACELETSMILTIRPELVKTELARGANVPFESAFYTPDFSKPSRVSVARAFEQVSETGSFGHPELATAEKGEELYQVATREIVKFVREFAKWEVFPPN